MKIIAITGLSGSGKSTLAKFLQQNLENSIHIDYDVLNKNLMNKPENIKYAISIFSESILNEDGSLNTKMIADIIFSNKELYFAWVGHMLMECDNEVSVIIHNTNYDWLIIEHNNIMFSRFSKIADYVILAKASAGERLKRLKKRENLEKHLLKQRDKHTVLIKDVDSVYNGKNENAILQDIFNLNLK